MAWTAGDLFDDTVTYVQSLPKAETRGGRDPSSSAEKLRLYSLFKQATLGPCTSKAPSSMLSPVERHKYDVYKGLGAMSTEAAKNAYVEILALKTLCQHQIPDDRAFNEELLAAGSGPCFPFLKAVIGKDPRAAGDPWENGFPDAWLEFAEKTAKAAELKPKEADMAVLTALYNQALFGDNFLPKPSMLGGMMGSVSSDLAAIKKPEWEAWDRLRGMPREKAMEEYTCKVDTLVENQSNA